MLSKTTDSSLNKMLSNGNPFLVNYKNGDLTGALSLIEKFGTTKTLSNPRLTVMNNQNAVLKIGENRVFFRLKYNQVYLDPLRKSDREGSGIITANSEIQTVPIGITLSVQPSINLDTGDITLSIRPTITNSHKNIADPAVQITSKDHNIKSEIPIIEVRELDSVLTMKSGNIAIIGGLMQEKSKDQTAGIPGTSGSFFEGLFGNSEYERTLTELVVFLKATILENPEPDAKDIQVYENSIHDNRPWRTK
jgi:general secretion pathway protein D